MLVLVLVLVLLVVVVIAVVGVGVVVIVVVVVPRGEGGNELGSEVSVAAQRGFGVVGQWWADGVGRAMRCGGHKRCRYR